MKTALTALLASLATLGVVRAQPHSQSCTTSPTAQPAPTVAADQQQQLFRDLLEAPTAIKRFQRLLVKDGSLLTGDALRELTVFNFNNAQPANGAKGGSTKAAYIDTFPILTGLDISVTVGFLEPCGINTPHVHPRATEFLTLIEGSNLRFGYVLENGLVEPGQNAEIAGTLSKLEGVLFPRASAHYQFNDACDRAVFLAALDSNDPGTLQLAQTLFSLNAGVVNATLGFPKTIDGKNIDDYRGLIPANLAQDVHGCLARCSGSAPAP